MAFSDLHTLNLDWIIREIQRIGGKGLTFENVSHHINADQSEDLVPSVPAVIDFINSRRTGYNAADYGVSTGNDPAVNSQALQALIDRVAGSGGGKIYIPAGVYRFGPIGTLSLGEYCIHLRSNVSVQGDGAQTELRIVGDNADGINLFHWNPLADNGRAEYLENCTFSDMLIDGSEQHCVNYTSAGKAFMVNLMKRCYWSNVHVRYIDATGFGMDCPVECGMVDCTAVHCGKATGDINAPGASGIGIGFGYSTDECMTISNCICNDNRHYGVFFEHQGRFSSTYGAAYNRGFVVSNCAASGNGYNYGAIVGLSVLFSGCHSFSPIRHGFFLDTSSSCTIKSCHHNGLGNAGSAGYAIYCSQAYGNWRVTDNVVQGCSCKYAHIGYLISSAAPRGDNTRISLVGNMAAACTDRDYSVSGAWGHVDVVNNSTDNDTHVVDGSQILVLVDKFNSWSSGAGGGAVESVNGKTGTVYLNADDVGAMTKHLLTYDGAHILDNGQQLSFQQLYSLLMDSNGFAVLVYGNYAYHPNAVTSQQIVFTAGYPVNGYDQVHRITMLSNGTITLTDTESEKTSSRVSAIGAGDVSSTSKYPSVKAVVDYVNTQVGVIELNLSTLADYAEEVST